MWRLFLICFNYGTKLACTRSPDYPPLAALIREQVFRKFSVQTAGRSNENTKAIDFIGAPKGFEPLFSP